MPALNTEFLDATNPQDLERAAELLKAGELVAVPTETVYGLAADASNAEAVANIFTAKNRPKDHPLIVHIGSESALAQWTRQIPDWLPAVANHFWPGPLTVILDKHPDVPAIVTGELDSVGVRIPSHPALLRLLSEHHLAVAAPSANPYKKLSPTTAEQVYDVMKGKIAAVLDGGPTSVGTESTILKVSGNHAQILRSGPIKAHDLAPYLPMPVETPLVHEFAVSGNKKEHYQPNAKLHLLNAENIQQQLQRSAPNSGFVVYGDLYSGHDHPTLQCLPSDDQGYRKRLYAALYELDKHALEHIFVLKPPENERWLDIWDRLQRACSD